MHLSPDCRQAVVTAAMRAATRIVTNPRPDLTASISYAAADGQVFEVRVEIVPADKAPCLPAVPHRFPRPPRSNDAAPDEPVDPMPSDHFIKEAA